MNPEVDPFQPSRNKISQRNTPRINILLLNTFLKAPPEAFKIIFQVLDAKAGIVLKTVWWSAGPSPNPISEPRAARHRYFHLVVFIHQDG